MKVRIVEVHEEDAFYPEREQIEGQVVESVTGSFALSADEFPEGIDHTFHEDEDYVFMYAKLEKPVETVFRTYQAGEAVNFYKVRIEKVS